MKFTMKWWDPRVVSNHSQVASKNHEIILSSTAVEKIWTPDMVIHDQTAIKTRDEWISLVSSKILMPDYARPSEKLNSSKANIEITYEIKSSVYCDFDHSRYPMDTQTCNVTFGSSSFGSIFVLENKTNTKRKDLSYTASTFEIETSFFDNRRHTSGENTIGISYTLTHSITPYLFKYYLPCMAIVTVSMIGFTIPLTAVPGRVALLVTQFLTLTNLFIYEMVNVVHIFY